MRERITPLGPFPQAFVTLIRTPWLAARLRIRSWGRLPRGRGPTVLAANHQHEDESEIVVERAYAGGPWRRPILTASSRRMYEPGFFAQRMPWLPFLRDVDAGPLFLALGMLPLENELSSRPVRSIAFELRARHGDLPLHAIFAPAAQPALPPDAATLSDLLAASRFAASQRHVKLAHVREPYRAELLSALRAQIAEDVARIVDAVRAGATFYVTPEGFYSSDGRMRPLKGILERLVAVADVRLAAIAFDPFRGRRLSMLYRIVAPANPADLATSLAAARPVTTSALLAPWLLAQHEPFTPEAAGDAVREARHTLPSAAFVDPELRDDGPAVDQALATMLRRGLLTRDGERLRLAASRGDRRFPQVADIVQFQANVLDETIAALRRLESHGTRASTSSAIRAHPSTSSG